jgi:hypothetical protein
MLCGWALARAHGRTGDPVAIAAYLGSKGRVPAAVLDFAEQYQQVVQDDYQAYLDALDGIEPLGDERVELPGWAG